jgi:hypothetical protein
MRRRTTAWMRRRTVARMRRRTTAWMRRPPNVGSALVVTETVTVPSHRPSSAARPASPATRLTIATSPRATRPATARGTTAPRARGTTADETTCRRRPGHRLPEAQPRVHPHERVKRGGGSGIRTHAEPTWVYRSGGRGGIRTHGGLATSTIFKIVAINLTLPPFQAARRLPVYSYKRMKSRPCTLITYSKTDCKSARFRTTSGSGNAANFASTCGLR